MQFVTFYIKDILYGVSILAVREISRLHDITQVQDANKRIDGLINLRGQIIPVLNLGTCLNDTPLSHCEDSRLVILKTDKELSSEAAKLGISTCKDNMALLVEKIGDVVEAVETEVEPAPAHTTHEYITGVIKLKKELLTLLSTEWLSNVEKSEEIETNNKI